MNLNMIYNTSVEQPVNDVLKQHHKLLKWLLILFLIIAHVTISLAQTNVDNTFQATSEFVPVIKESAKFADLPEIKDTVKRISNVKYGIVSNPLFPKYQVQKIDAAKMQNEPLTKLYHSLLKVGYGPLYNMPYGEFFISNLRSRDVVFGAHLKHLSSSKTLENTGYSGFSDNYGTVYGKKFYKKHTLNGDITYNRNVVHYYGYDPAINTINDNDYIKQRYQLVEPKLVLQSHFTDSSKINHTINAGFYNLQNLHKEAENNVNVGVDASMFLNHEKLNLGFSTNYYNHKQSNDTLNDLIISLAPSFEAQGKKWKALVGLKGTLDNFKGKTRFYGYPQLNVEYDIYESIIIPYAGATGGLMKNSLRSLSNENPFIDTTLNYVNTNNKYNLYLGLKGSLSSNTSYDVKGSYSQMDSMHFYVINYSGINQMYNQFDVIYDNASVIHLSGQIKHQMKEKIHFITKGNYYVYNTKNLTRAYHKPDFDLTFSTIYNLQSKIILRAEVFAIGKQWMQTQILDDTNKPVLTPKQLNGLVDVNLEGEYRYSKMLSFFARVNNIANQRYYRWERYPTQRFNFTIGLTFVPF
ncbi:MAG: hypothetical protein ACK50A_05420 [Sphingobacteriaceae bacterium]